MLSDDSLRIDSNAIYVIYQHDGGVARICHSRRLEALRTRSNAQQSTACELDRDIKRLLRSDDSERCSKMELR